MASKSVPPLETYVFQPGLHSHSGPRHPSRLNPNNLKRQPRRFKHLRLVLLAIGIGCLGFYAYTLADEYIYQAYQNWAFDQQIAGGIHVTPVDYIRQETPFGFLLGRKAIDSNSPESDSPKLANTRQFRPSEGDVLGRVSISRLNISAIVREGVSAKTLSVAVGHVPTTALPGQLGNFAVAAHRDTLFRALKDIRTNDLVTVQTNIGNFAYRVVATTIVKPSDVSVLRSDGGGLISPQLVTRGQLPGKLLTMITCYPFHYLGAAPKRFIVEGMLVGTDSPAMHSPEKIVAPVNQSAPEVAPALKRHGSRRASSPRARKPAMRPRSRPRTQQGLPDHDASIRKPAPKRNLLKKLLGYF